MVSPKMKTAILLPHYLFLFTLIKILMKHIVNSFPDTGLPFPFLKK